MKKISYSSLESLEESFDDLEDFELKLQSWGHQRQKTSTRAILIALTILIVTTALKFFTGV